MWRRVHALRSIIRARLQWNSGKIYFFLHISARLQFHDNSLRHASFSMYKSQMVLLEPLHSKYSTLIAEARLTILDRLVTFKNNSSIALSKQQGFLTVGCAVLGTSLLLTLFFIGCLCYSDIHDVPRGLLGLMGRSPRVFSFRSFDCFDKQRIGFK